MSRWATFALFLTIFGLAALFRGDWIKLGASGFGLGFVIAFIAWRLDRQLHRFGGTARWAMLRIWAVGGCLFSSIAAGMAYWFSKQDALVSGAGAFIGVGLAALFTEMLARPRSLA